MILIPGLSCPGEVWDGTVAHYKDNYQLHVISLAGFAGVPRVPGPFLDTAREAIAAYVRKNKLDHPIIVGHSLGGFLALDLAVHYPDLPGKLVIVDSYPMMAGIMDPNMTSREGQATSEQIRKGMEQQSQDMYERTDEIRHVHPPDGHQGFRSRSRHRLESEVRPHRRHGQHERTLRRRPSRRHRPKSRSPVLVMGAWIGYKEYGATHDTTEANLRAQYAKLEGVRIAVTDTSRHFIMWDDPNWMFAQMDRFLEPAKTISAR